MHMKLFVVALVIVFGLAVHAGEMASWRAQSNQHISAEGSPYGQRQYDVMLGKRLASNARYADMVMLGAFMLFSLA